MRRSQAPRAELRGGVAIILSPVAIDAWREAGSKPPITTIMESLFAGRFIGVKLSFPKFKKWGRRKRGYLKLFIASIYHPVDETEYEEFNNTLSSLLNSIPRLDEFIGGHDVNANLGVRSKIHHQ